eukprot:TRINITY_DN87211_c0_g1_i1.p1 TRINITY_DN87211_c0_g1~~TRINITY_DN87211_c0_g1_i1.p1  ORF type:complete len:281 (+),score=10.32 TRINITY_DN87211_c0_g1_i1:28-843(+)
MEEEEKEITPRDLPTSSLVSKLRNATSTPQPERVTPAQMAASRKAVTPQPTTAAAARTQGSTQWQHLHGLYKVVIKSQNHTAIENWFNTVAESKHRRMFKEVMKGIYGSRPPTPQVTESHPLFKLNKTFVDAYCRKWVCHEMIIPTITYLCNNATVRSKFVTLARSINENKALGAPAAVPRSRFFGFENPGWAKATCMKTQHSLDFQNPENRTSEDWQNLSVEEDGCNRTQHNKQRNSFVEFQRGIQMYRRADFSAFKRTCYLRFTNSLIP